MATDPLKARLRGLISDIVLVGKDDEIKTQLALLLGIGQLTESQQKGLDLNFQKFIDAFEDGFYKGFAPKQNKELSQYWGQALKTRPRIRVLKENRPGDSDSWTNQGYYLIELQPDRANEEESYLLFGTPANLIQEIMYWMNMHKKLANLDVKTEGSGANYREPISPNFKDYLQLTLHWRGVSEITYKGHHVAKSIRLKAIDAKTVSLSYLKELGVRVLEKFDGLVFKTGHVKAKYTNWEDGIQTWGYFETENAGYKVIEAMGDIINKPINKELLRYERRGDPLEAFPQKGYRTTVATKSVRTKAKAPIATMKFSSATITFPYIQHTELLCSASGYILKDLKFLNAYED